MVRGSAQESSCGTTGSGSGIVTAAAQVAAVAQVQSLAQELPHATGHGQKNKIDYLSFVMLLIIFYPFIF